MANGRGRRRPGSSLARHHHRLENRAPLGDRAGAFANWLFGDSSLTVEDISFPARAAEVPDFCDRNYRAWRDGIGSIDEERWWRPLGPKWHPYAEATTVDLALHVFDEIVHHGAEVGVLRDLDLRRDQLS